MSEKIAVLMGGRSLEREVSLRSGQRVMAALESRGFRVVPLDLVPDFIDAVRRERPDAAYIALHGKYGEDGAIQELLDILKIPYTGSGVLSCALSWDKDVSKRLFVDAEIPTPPWVAFSSSAIKDMGAARALDLVPPSIGGFPLVVKPAGQGSALGLTRVDDADALPDAMLSALSFDTKVIVEKWIDGCELAVSVLRNEEGVPEVLPPVEIVAKSGLFDYSAMYTQGETEYYVPARLAEGALARVRDLALRVHELLGCRDVSRTDMVVDAAGEAWVLECNTSPGMTETSLLPMAAESAGITFEDAVERLTRAALARE